MAFHQAADVLILPTSGTQSVASIPSKLIRYMLSGRPIIAACLPGTELFNIINLSQCGWVIPPDDQEALAKAIQESKRVGANERDQRGMAGREYALKNLTADTNLPKLVKIIEEISD